MARQTKITIETGHPAGLAWTQFVARLVPASAADGDMIPIEGVGVISNLSPAEVEAWLESESIHSAQTDDGGLVICLNSLLKCVAEIEKT